MLSNTGKVTQLLVFIKVDCSENSRREERYFIHILDKVNIVRLVCYGLSILTILYNLMHFITLEYIVTFEGQYVSMFNICPSVTNAYKGEFNLPTTLETTTMYRE